MNHLFKFVDNSSFSGGDIDCEPGLANAIANTVERINSGSGLGGSTAPTAEPDGNSTIDVTKNFKWTKTARGSIGREGTPSIELEELYVVRPAFYSNLNLFLDQLNIGTDLVGNGLSNISKGVGFGEAGESITQVQGKVTGLLTDVQKEVQAAGSKAFKTEKQKPIKYLKAYEELYGVRRSGFNYRLPYLEDKFRSTSTSWGEDKAGISFLENLPLVGNFAQSVQSLFSAVVPGVGIDYAKSFSYGGNEPEYSFSFYLDNTKDSEYGPQSMQNNIEFITLLMYQNLPNKLNRLAISPPVIYRAKLPGVFYFNYSYLSNITVEFVGVRREKTVRLKVAEFGKEEENIMIVPEGYKVNITLKSLLPETRNFMYASLDDKVFATQEELVARDLENMPQPDPFALGNMDPYSTGIA